MKIEAVGSRDEAFCLEDVGAEFVDVAGCSRVVACCLDAAGESSCLHLETFHIVRLPAVHAEVEVLKLCENLFCVDSKFGITLLGDFICLVDEFLFHIFMFFLDFSYCARIF